MGGGTKEAVIETEEEQAQVDIWKYSSCAIELGIADVLENHDGPMSLSDLSSALCCSPAALYRIMRFLMHRGVFKEKSTGQDVAGYVQTPLSRLLMKHGLNSMAAFVLFESSPVMLAPWHCLSARVLAAGTSAFEAAHGDDVFEGLGSLVDVGGGDGTSLGMVVKACPWIRGINFDLPHVVSLAPNCDSVEHVGGNMFESIPRADAAYLMWVLHDWGDDECIHILKKCRESIPQDTGKVIIVEAVIGEREGEKLKDIYMVMMAHTNKGKERTLDEWAHVLHEAGFRRHTVKHIRAVQSVIEAYP
ncbi:hypothetical protein RJ639_022018 [Escallonia herrerae]|uniref:O-methyltransferase n=1 Tax=Escallonia herrerae TaxID=1293975 RepID=A0AA88V7T5_9ASTE|nr:hypothetical protein RJ639_022018 [Escallonia herrerae]